MSVLFRVQNNTPRVYYNESRDFQLIGRLYDCIINGIKHDIDSTSYLTDSKLIRSTMLQLLQTKLGFFTKEKFNDEQIRYILRAFPVLVKQKGSIKAVQEAVNMFLKMNHIKSSIRVWYVSDATVVYGTEVDDHTIIIGMGTAFQNYTPLMEVLRYILPTGFGFYFYYFSDITAVETELMENKAKLIFVSDNINSQVRGQDIEDDTENRLIGAIDTVYVASDDSIVPTVDGTYKVSNENKSLFVGIYKDLSEITTAPVNGQYCIANQIPYYYEDNKWNKINFTGIKSELPTSGRHKYDIVGINNKNVYYYYTNNSWQALNFRGDYNNASEVILPKDLDCIRIDGNYYFYNNNIWNLIESQAEKVTSLTKIKEMNEGDFAIVNGVTYYLFNGNAWIDNTLAIYTLVVKEFK